MIIDKDVDRAEQADTTHLQFNKRLGPPRIFKVLRGGEGGERNEREVRIGRGWGAAGGNPRVSPLGRFRRIPPPALVGRKKISTPPPPRQPAPNQPPLGGPRFSRLKAGKKVGIGGKLAGPTSTVATTPRDAPVARHTTLSACLSDSSPYNISQV